MYDITLRTSLQESFGVAIHDVNKVPAYEIVEEAIRRTCALDRYSRMSIFMQETLDCYKNSGKERYRADINLLLMCRDNAATVTSVSAVYNLLRHYERDVGSVLYLDPLRIKYPDSELSTPADEYTYYDGLWVDKGEWCLFDTKLYDYRILLTVCKSDCDSVKRIISNGFIYSMFYVYNKLNPDCMMDFWIAVSEKNFSILKHLVRAKKCFKDVTFINICKDIVNVWSVAEKGKSNSG